MNIEPFEESKLRFKKQCNHYQAISKIISMDKFKNNINEYIYRKKDKDFDKLTEKQKNFLLKEKIPSYVFGYGTIRSIDLRNLFIEILGSKMDTFNTFIDEDDNHCILYDDYCMKIEHEINVMNEFMKIMEIDEPIEIFKLERGMRDPPFLKRTFHRDYGILLRMTPNKISSNTKSANKR
ncbi:MAG: hypothetical protein KFKLKKLM_02631 [Flavobacteriales bacterium]|nr:hypothetical protein [Flavobacteriales bacterium]